MPRPKKPGYEKTTINMRSDLKRDIYGKFLPYEGAQDLGAFLELGAERLIQEIKEKRKPRRNP